MLSSLIVQEIYILTPPFDYKLGCSSRGNGLTVWDIALVAILAALGSVPNPFRGAIWPREQHLVNGDSPQLADQVRFHLSDSERAH